MRQTLPNVYRHKIDIEETLSTSILSHRETLVQGLLSKIRRFRVPPCFGAVNVDSSCLPSVYGHVYRHLKKSQIAPGTFTKKLPQKPEKSSGIFAINSQPRRVYFFLILIIILTMAVLKKIKIYLLLTTLSLGSIPLTYAESSANTGLFITRGEAVHDIVDTFDLKTKNAQFIKQCLDHLDECFFVFTAMTRYYQVSLDPMQLYPDVTYAYRYASDINIATMLGLVHGNIDEKNSPFYPRSYMTRIQALKVILGAADLMDWREKFELVRDLGNEDALRNQTSPFKDVSALPNDTWWYPRYVNFALDVGIIDAGQYFRPDEAITNAEFRDMLTRALKESETFHAATNPQAQPSADSSQQALH